MHYAIFQNVCIEYFIQFYDRDDKAQGDISISQAIAKNDTKYNNVVVCVCFEWCFVNRLVTYNLMYCTFSLRDKGYGNSA